MFNFFKKRKDFSGVAIDVGSHSVKTVIFEYGENRKLPRVLKKTVHELPEVCEPSFVLGKLREIVFSLVKESGRVPEKITIGLGPNLAECAVQNWSVQPTSKGRVLTSDDFRSGFHAVFDERRKHDQALLAAPFGVLVNGYYLPQFADQNCVKQAILLPASAVSVPSAFVQQIGFQTVVLYFSVETGTALVEAKQSLGGMPIEYIPLIVANRHALVCPLRVKDALLADIGGETTSLMFLKEGQPEQIFVFSMGARSFLQGISKLSGSSFAEAGDIKKQYIEGVVSDTLKPKLRAFFEEKAAVWKKHFLEGLDYFYTVGPLPPTLFLTGGGAHMAEIKDALKGDWIKPYSFAESPDIKVAKAEDVFGADTLNGFLSGPQEFGLASLMFYSMYHRPIF